MTACLPFSAYYPQSAVPRRQNSCSHFYRIPFPLQYSILHCQRHTGAHWRPHLRTKQSGKALFTWNTCLHWSSLPSPAIYPQGKVHVATIYINSLYNAAVRYNVAGSRHFVTSDLIRKAATLQRDGKENEWVRTNGRLTGRFQ